MPKWRKKKKNTEVSYHPLPGDLPNSGVKPGSPTCPAFADGFFTTSSTWEAQMYVYLWLICTVYGRNPLEKEMATHSSVLAWRIPGMRSHRVQHD